MYANGRYIMPLDVVALLEGTKLGAASLRLVHGLYYLANVATKKDPSLIGAMFVRPRSIRAAQIRADVGTVGCKDNDWLRAAIAGLEESDLFDVLTLSENGRAVTFKPSKRLNEKSLKVKRFAPLATRHIAACHTVRDMLFYTQAAMAHGLDYRMFELPRIGAAPLGEPWAACRDGWVAAAEKVGAMLGHNYLIGPVTTPLDTVASEVRVKASHAKSIWQPGVLYRFPIGTRPIQVIDGRKRGALTKKQLEARVNWCTIRENVGEEADAPTTGRAAASSGVERPAASASAVGPRRGRPQATSPRARPTYSSARTRSNV